MSEPHVFGNEKRIEKIDAMKLSDATKQWYKEILRTMDALPTAEDQDKWLKTNVQVAKRIVNIEYSGEGDGYNPTPGHIVLSSPEEQALREEERKHWEEVKAARVAAVLEHWNRVKINPVKASQWDEQSKKEYEEWYDANKVRAEQIDKELDDWAATEEALKDIPHHGEKEKREKPYLI